jgi:nicotinamidase-related amidase/type 1 glutamine amidotransferase
LTLLAVTPILSAADPLVLHTRTRVETSPGSGRFHTIVRPESWDPAKTAIVICDMWDRHWCQGATRRVAQMAPRMNEVLKAARSRGVLIIHAPSDTMPFYKDTPQYQLAHAAPSASPRTPIADRCSLDYRKEHTLPIDDSDGGCDCVPTCRQGSPWRRQIDILQIEPQDAVTDSEKAFQLMRARGIDNVILMGVHTNMCVLGRPFAIRQMVKLGQRVVLMRDMTDTMYNSRSAPFVNHFTGTDLVIEHIETFWCPTITSADFLGGAPFRFPDDHRPDLAIVMAEDEYETHRSLPAFALRNLGRDFRVHLVFGSDRDRNDIPGLDILDHADALLVSVRRRPLPAKQLEHVRRFVQAGKPVVGIRTASHAFSLRDEKSTPPALATWPSFDADVFGGNYTNHHGGKGSARTLISIDPAAKDHPISTGIDFADLAAPSWLYKVSPLRIGTTPLLIGRIDGVPMPEPVAWTFSRSDGGRSFYTSLGHPGDFELPQYRRLLYQGLLWALDRPIPPEWIEPDADSLAIKTPASLLSNFKNLVEEARARPKRP